MPFHCASYVDCHDADCAAAPLPSVSVCPSTGATALRSSAGLTSTSIAHSPPNLLVRREMMKRRSDDGAASEEMEAEEKESGSSSSQPLKKHCAGAAAEKSAGRRTRTRTLTLTVGCVSELIERVTFAF